MPLSAEKHLRKYKQTPDARKGGSPAFAIYAQPSLLLMSYTD